MNIFYIHILHTHNDSCTNKWWWHVTNSQIGIENLFVVEIIRMNDMFSISFVETRYGYTTCQRCGMQVVKMHCSWFGCVCIIQTRHQADEDTSIMYSNISLCTYILYVLCLLLTFTLILYLHCKKLLYL